MHLQTLLLSTLCVAFLSIHVIHANEALPLGKRYIMFGSIPQSGRINPLHSLATELASRGHETTFFSMERGHYTSKEQANKNVPFVSLGNYSDFCSEDAFAKLPPVLNANRSPISVAGLLKFRRILKDLGKCLNPAYSEIITKLHQSFRQKRPDLCVTDYMSIAYFDACTSLNITTVIMRPGFLPKSVHYVPPVLSGASIRTTFWQRLSWDFKLHLFHYYSGGPLPFNKMLTNGRNKYFGENHNLPDMAICCVNIVTTVFGIEYAQETAPLNFLVGPLLKDDELVNSYAAEDPKCNEMDSWLEANPRIVFTNFGSTGLLNQELFNAMLDGFSLFHTDEEFDNYKVLWRISKTHQKILINNNVTIPSFIRVESWLCSQQRVMAHPSIKLFITHGGANSPNEALYNEKPMIVVPGFADQFDMASRLKDAGVAEIFMGTFAASEFASALTTMLHSQNHASYVLRAKYLSQLLKRAGGRRRAADLIEEIIELGGYEHLVPYSVNHMTYIQRKGLDIMAAYIVIALVWVGVTVVLGKIIVRWVWRMARGRIVSKVDSQKKIQ